MMLRRIFLMPATLCLAIVLLLGLTGLRLYAAADATTQAENVRLQSYLYADELRRSSDDMTRFVRSFAQTGDERFEKMYWDVAAIRNGELPRPQDYRRIYWDFVVAGDSKPRPDGQAVPLRRLMQDIGFTPQEFSCLNEAQAKSDALMRIEMVAINAVKGRFEDDSGLFTHHGRPNRELARQLLNDAQYDRYKAQIMLPIDNFYVLFEQRTNAAVQEAKMVEQRWLLTL
jgi:methyl-accepting chemotaxis protein